MPQSEKRHHLLITSVFVFVCVCLKGEGHKEDKDGGRVKRDSFNVAITVVRWQLGCDGAIVQSCLYKVGQKHMTCTSDSQSSAMNHENNMAANLYHPDRHSSSPKPYLAVNERHDHGSTFRVLP